MTLKMDYKLGSCLKHKAGVSSRIQQTVKITLLDFLAASESWTCYCTVVCVCVCVCACVCACAHACACACLSVCLSVCLSACLSVYLSVRLSVSLSLCLSVCLSIHIFLIQDIITVYAKNQQVLRQLAPKRSLTTAKSQTVDNKLTELLMAPTELRTTILDSAHLLQ